MFLFVSKLYFLPYIYIFFLFYFYNYVMFNKPARVLVPIIHENDPIQMQQKIGGVSEIAHNLKSYLNSMCHGKRIGDVYFLNMGECINNYINILYIVLNT